MNSSHTVLDSVALAYQPVWNWRRQLAAVRVRVVTVHHASVDAAHLLRAIGEDWPAAAPLLVLSFASASLLEQALHAEPMRHSWIEVPGAWMQSAEGLARLAVSVRSGHTLLRHAALAEVHGEVVPPLDLLSLLRPSAEEALQALQAVHRPATAGAAPLPGHSPLPGSMPPPVSSPLPVGQLFEGLASHALAEHALDALDAWGVAGWPEEDLLFGRRHQPAGCDASVLAQIRQGIDEDRSIDQIERYLRQDPVLAYRLLLLANASARGDREIESLRHAILLLGFGALGRWLTEQQAHSDPDAALHPVRYAQVMRARLAQHLLDSEAAEPLRAEVFLCAALAELDRLLQVPLPQLLERLPLPQRTQLALLQQEGPYQPLLALSAAQAQFDQAHRLPLLCEQLDISLEHANRALLRMLATSRDRGGTLAPPRP